MSERYPQRHRPEKHEAREYIDLPTSVRLEGYTRELLAPYFPEPADGSFNLPLSTLVGSIVSMMKGVYPTYRQQALFSRFQTETALIPAIRLNLAKIITEHLNAK